MTVSYSLWTLTRHYVDMQTKAGQERCVRGLLQVVFGAVSHDKHDCQGLTPLIPACSPSFGTSLCQTIASGEILPCKHFVGLSG